MKFKIPKPCSAKWSEMTSQENARYCSACQKEVIDVSTLSPKQAEHQLSQEDTCARITYDKQGAIKTKNGFSSLILIGGLLGCPSEVPTEGRSDSQNPSATTQTLTKTQSNNSTQSTVATVSTTKTDVHTKTNTEQEIITTGEVMQENSEEESCEKVEPKATQISMGKVKQH